MGKPFHILSIYSLGRNVSFRMEQIYSSISQEITRMNCTYKQTQNIAYYSGLEEAQAGIKIAGRNINNLRYADDTTLMAESEEELKSLLMKVKEESEKLA